MHVMYEIFPHLIMKFLLVICSFLFVSLNVLVRFFQLWYKLFKKWKKLTNTFKHTRKWAKYKKHLIIRHGRISHTTCIIFIHFCLCWEKNSNQVPKWVQRILFVQRLNLYKTVLDSKMSPRLYKLPVISTINIVSKVSL